MAFQQGQQQDGVPPAFGDPWANSRWHAVPATSFQWIWRQNPAAYLTTCVVQIKSTDGQNYVRDFELRYTNLEGVKNKAYTVKGLAFGPNGSQGGLLSNGLGDCKLMEQVNVAGAQVTGGPPFANSVWEGPVHDSYGTHTWRMLFRADGTVQRSTQVCPKQPITMTPLTSTMGALTGTTASGKCMATR